MTRFPWEDHSFFMSSMVALVLGIRGRTVPVEET